MCLTPKVLDKPCILHAVDYGGLGFDETLFCECRALLNFTLRNVSRSLVLIDKSDSYALHSYSGICSIRIMIKHPEDQLLIIGSEPVSLTLWDISC